jgi:hypothetical protein
MSPIAAAQWIQKLDDHNARDDDDQKKLDEADIAALGDLAIIVSFMHVASTAVSMAPLSRKSGLLFITRASSLNAELNSLKPKADFGDYLIPMDNLLEPKMATQALAAPDNFVIQETGARLGLLSEDIVQDSLKNLERMYAEAKHRLDRADKQTTYVPLPTEATPTRDARLAHRLAKEETRPAGLSVYTITAPQRVRISSSPSPRSSSRSRRPLYPPFPLCFPNQKHAIWCPGRPSRQRWQT